MAPNKGRIFGAKEDVKEHFCELKLVTLSAVHQGAPDNVIDWVYQRIQP